MKIAGTKIYIGPSFFVCLSYILALKGAQLIPMLTAVALHELGHIICAQILRIRISSVRLSVLGASIVTQGTYSYKKELLLCLAGPLFNLIMLPLATRLSGAAYVGGFFIRLRYACLSLALFNLTPLRPLDGGRALHSALALLAGLRAADAVCLILSGTIIATLWITSIYMLIKFGASISVFIFSVALFVSVFVERGTPRST